MIQGKKCCRTNPTGQRPIINCYQAGKKKDAIEFFNFEMIGDFFNSLFNFKNSDIIPFFNKMTLNLKK